MKFRLVEDRQLYNITDKELFNVARTFSSDYIPNGKKVIYIVEVTYPYNEIKKYNNKKEAIDFADKIVEEDETSDVTVKEIIYNSDNSIYNEEIIYSYYY